MGYIPGTSGVDTLEGTSGSDTIAAMDGDDKIYGSTGSDSVDGGGGFDTLIFDFSKAIFNYITLSNPGGAMPNPFVFNLTSGSFTSGDGSISTTFGNIEAFLFNPTYALGNVAVTLDMSSWVAGGAFFTTRIITGDGNDLITGSAYDDYFFTLRGQDVVNAGAGFDLVDTALEASEAWAYVTRSGSTDYITQNGVHILTATNAERLGAGSYAVSYMQRVDASASALPMNFYDGLGNDTFIGSAFNDAFFTANTQTGGGTDTLTGGGGNDLFDFTYAAQGLNGTTITDFSIGDTIDLNYNDISTYGTVYQISSFIGSAAFSGVAGQYRFAFSGGQTLVQFDSNGDAVADGTLTIANGRFALETFDNGNGAHALRIANPNIITGTASFDMIHGTAGPDQISALGGSDRIFASAGIDTVDGGAGTDTFSIDFGNIGEVVGNLAGPVTFTLTPTHFSDNLGVFNSTLANVERVVFNPTYALANRDVVFNASTWVPTSGSGANQYNFANGNDTVTGSASNELIYTNGGVDVVDAGGGFDSVGTALDGTASWAYITQSGGASYVIQNGIYLLTATNVERIGAGNFTATYIQKVDGSASILPVEFYDGLGNDTFIGSANDDIFITIDNQAGGGTDLLTGGGGNDLFDFTFAAQALNGTTITDFSIGDTIDLNFNDQASGALYQIDSFIGSSAFTGVAGQFRYTFSSGKTLVQFDSNGDSIADGTLTISNGQFALQAFNNGNGPSALRIAGSNAINGTANPDIIHGTAGADQISALGGDDSIFASSGSDTVDGGSGFDTFSVNFGFAGEIAGNLSNPVTITLTASHFSDSSGVFDTTLINIERVYFNTTYFMPNRSVVFDASAWAPASGSSANVYAFSNGNDTVTGSSYDEIIYTNGGIDVVDAGGGYDAVGTALDGSSAWAYITQSAGTSYVTQNAVHLLSATNAERIGAGNYAANYVQRVDASTSTLAVDFYDGLGNDTFVGSALDDIFYSVNTFAGSGTDTLTGGGGNDLFDFSYAAQSLNGTTITDFSLGDAIDLSFNVQANGSVYQIDTFIGSAAFTGIAGQFRYGFSSGQTLVQFDSNGDGIADGTLTISNGQFALEQFTTSQGGTHGLRIVSVNVVNGTAGNDNLPGTDGVDQIFGLGGNDTIFGNGGNDTLDGGIGADTMSGGIGDDLYYVDNGGDVVTELVGEGLDEVRTGLASYALTANVENLTGTSGGGQTLVGNGLANTIQGGAGNDVINGLAGNDVMKGGAGNDAYYVYDAGDVVSELYGEGTDIVYAYASHTLGANVENLTLLAAGLIGTGNAAGNLIYGSGGADTIHGMGGGDRIDGGGGNDVIHGGDGADSIWGSAGNDTIHGDAGLDYMVGGTGDDTYYVDDAGDTAIEQVGEGTDTVYASTAYHQLRPNIEVLIGTLSTGQTLVGNYGADTIQGGAGNDTLNGLTGNDTMKGGAGNDGYYVYDAGDVVVENPGEGTDTVYTYVSHTLEANVENLTLLNAGQVGTGNGLANTIYGSSGIDTIFGLGGADQIASGGGADTIDAGEGDDLVWGGAGNDVIRGGLGFDRLRGEAGADRFVFGEGETSASRASADRLLDFSQGDGDRIDLSLIDANSTGGAPGDQAFAFIGSAAFTSVAGQLRFEQSGGYTYVEGDTNGDAIADFSIQLGSILTPTVADFVM